MIKWLLSRLRKFDLIFLIAVCLLVVLGLTTLKSTTMETQFFSAHLMQVQIWGICLGAIAFLVITFTPPRYYYYLAPLFYTISLVSLGLVLLFGQEIRGSTRWLAVGDLQLQPSEIFKSFIILAFAAFLAKAGQKINWWPMTGVYLLILLGPLWLVFLQPDLGSVVLLAVVWLLLMFVSALELKRLLLLTLFVLFVGGLGVTVLADYQKQRIVSFFNPQLDRLGAGYSTVQSMIAVGSGGLTGRGWGQGTQSHLQFLPEHHTDFIFAAYAEEMGFLGVLILWWLYFLIAWRSIRLVTKTGPPFENLLVVGCVATILIEAIINTAMNVGLLPVTGTPLPLVSYGGSAMVGNFLLLGLIHSVAVHGQV